MNKYLYILSVFFISILLTSCSNSITTAQEESISIELPQWPPKDHCYLQYPLLSRWKITIQSENICNTFYITPNTNKTKNINLSVLKNQPLSITAQPITKDKSDNEILFFKPAGFLYPYNKNIITWENGFLASIMASLFQENNKQNRDATIKLITSFNWKKASQIINEKINNTNNYYNPWLLNRQNILEKISSKAFSSTYLNISSVYSYKTSKQFISSFIPDNNKIVESNYIYLKKDNPLLFFDTPSLGTLFTYKSSKKVSLESVFLPIYIEEL